MQLNVSNSPIGRPAGGARVEAETHTPARPRAEKCAQDHDHPARAVVHRPSTRPPRAINKLVINGPCDAHGARTRSGETAQTEPKRRPQGKRTRVYTDSRFQFHTATRTGHKFQVTNFVHGRPRGSVAARERACATLRPAGCGQRAGRSRTRHCGLISAIISLKFATRTTDRDGCYTCILA